VPTLQDFIDLDIALGGTGENRGGVSEEEILRYTGTGANQWGAVFGGYILSYNDEEDQGFTAGYWSQTEVNLDRGHSLFVSTYTYGGYIYSQATTGKSSGIMLRCVR
jgi:hypothetical protein